MSVAPGIPDVALPLPSSLCDTVSVSERGARPGRPFCLCLSTATETAKCSRPLVHTACIGSGYPLPRLCAFGLCWAAAAARGGAILVQKRGESKESCSSSVERGKEISERSEGACSDARRSLQRNRVLGWLCWQATLPDAGCCRGRIGAVVVEGGGAKGAALGPLN